MKKATLLGLGLVVVFLWSCGSATNSTADNSAATPIENDDHADHHYNESSEPLKLNDGDRWVVNEEMKPYVKQGADLVDQFLAQSDQGDYQSLATDLREQNQLLIQNCTMTGVSHDELHKWLHPHMALVEELAGSESETEARDWAQHLQDSYTQYHAFFQ